MVSFKIFIRDDSFITNLPFAICDHCCVRKWNIAYVYYFMNYATVYTTECGGLTELVNGKISDRLKRLASIKYFVFCCRVLPENLPFPQDV